MISARMSRVYHRRLHQKQSEHCGDERANYVGKLVSEARGESADEAIRDGSEECGDPDEQSGSASHHSEGEGEQGRGSGSEHTSGGSRNGDRSIRAGRNLFEGRDQTRSPAGELSDLGLGGVGEGGPERGGESRCERSGKRRNHR